MATKFVPGGAAVKILIPAAKALEKKARALAVLKGWSMEQALTYLRWQAKHEEKMAEKRGMK